MHARGEWQRERHDARGLQTVRYSVASLCIAGDRWRFDLETWRMVEGPTILPSGSLLPELIVGIGIVIPRLSLRFSRGKEPPFHAYSTYQDAIRYMRLQSN